MENCIHNILGETEYIHSERFSKLTKMPFYRVKPTDLRTVYCQRDCDAIIS